ncbi:MAG: uncharacterized protein JWN07_2721, partial [Hyphomicrobiales bacterium]|nr:uncharacterized protein [Hyphomicrobiales bacterium]
MHLRADFWVAAYVRRVGVEGAFAMLRRRGAAEAGAIFVKVDRLDGHAALYGPAPQSELADRTGIDRLWMRLHKEEWTDPATVEEKMAREMKFDPDLWLIEVEDPKGRCFLDLA